MHFPVLPVLVVLPCSPRAPGAPGVEGATETLQRKKNRKRAGAPSRLDSCEPSRVTQRHSRHEQTDPVIARIGQKTARLEARRFSQPLLASCRPSTAKIADTFAIVSALSRAALHSRGQQK